MLCNLAKKPERKIMMISELPNFLGFQISQLIGLFQSKVYIDENEFREQLG